MIRFGANAAGRISFAAYGRKSTIAPTFHDKFFPLILRVKGKCFIQ
jgi:hypothetical protein